MTPFRLLVGDAREELATLPPAAARCCVTSPPYWQLRDYGHPAQLGQEATPDEYVDNLVRVFRGVRRILTDDGTLWLNLGDSYAGARGGGMGKNSAFAGRNRKTEGRVRLRTTVVSGLKPKELVGIPWRVAFALQRDGWWLRQEIIWHKPNAMPESVRDRCTKAHESVFLLAKSQEYFFNTQANQEPVDHPAGPGNKRHKYVDGKETHRTKAGLLAIGARGTRNRRDVWSIATQPYPGDHDAPMPRNLARRCVLLGSEAGDTVLDPFGGVGTTGLVALEEGRRFLGVELNEQHARAAEERVRGRTLGLGVAAGGR